MPPRQNGWRRDTWRWLRDRPSDREREIAISSHSLVLPLRFEFLSNGGRQLGIRIPAAPVFVFFKTADFFGLHSALTQHIAELWNRAADFHPITGKRLVILFSFCMALGAPLCALRGTVWATWFSFPISPLISDCLALCTNHDLEEQVSDESRWREKLGSYAVKSYTTKFTPLFRECRQIPFFFLWYPSIFPFPPFFIHDDGGPSSPYRTQIVANPSACRSQET